MSLILGIVAPKLLVYAMAALSWVCVVLLIAQVVGFSGDRKNKGDEQ